MMEKIIKLLGLEDDASEEQVLEVIADLKFAAEGDDEKAHIDRIKEGTHEQVALQADGSLVLTLQWPIKSGKEDVGELRLSRPTGKQMKMMDNEKGDIAKSLAFLAACSGRSPKEIEKLDSADIEVGAACLSFFRKSGRRTGAAS